MNSKEEKNEKSTANLLAILFAFIIGLTVGNIDGESLRELKDQIFYKEGTSLVSRSHSDLSAQSASYPTAAFSSTEVPSSTVIKTEASTERASEPSTVSTTAAPTQTTTTPTETTAAPTETTVTPTETATAPTETTTTHTETTSAPTETTVTPTETATAPTASTSQGTTTSHAVTSTPKQTVTKSATDNGDYLTIYRTPTGKRYHFSPACAGKNKIETGLDEAEQLGLTPCKKCAGG